MAPIVALADWCNHGQIKVHIITLKVFDIDNLVPGANPDDLKSNPVIIL